MSLSTSARQQKYSDELNRLATIHKDEKVACSLFVKALPEDELARLQKLASETKFNRRKYGKSNFFCWPIHPVFEDRGVDPWPAMNYPKNVLIADFARRT